MHPMQQLPVALFCRGALDCRTTQISGIAHPADARFVCVYGLCDIAGDLPDMSKCVRGIAQAGDRQATLHGVVFDILGAGAA